MKKLAYAVFALLVCVSLIYVASLAKAGTTIYVGEEETYTTIQAGIDAASNGDTVIVRDDTYTGSGNKNLDFGGKAITVKSENGPADCIIDCQDSGRGFCLHNSETNSAVIDGFNIKNAEINNLNGAGIYCDGASPQIKNCVIENCDAKYGWTNGRGGAIYCKSSTAKITNCTMKNNIGGKHGGGVYLDSSNAEIVDCMIDNNSAGGNGGGIFCGGSSSSSPTIKNCRVINNSTDTYGGGVYCASNASPAITNCVIADNSAGSNGGGVFCTGDPAIVNCTIANNSATNYGGGLRSYYGASPTVKNSIVWGNTANTGSQLYGAVAVTYSDVQGGWTGTGNIDSDPKFVDSAGEDYHLQVDSPCIDTANNADVPAGVTTDLDGRTRIFDGDGNSTATVDMGPYEVQGLNYILNSVAPTQAHIGKPVSFSVLVKNVDDTAADLSISSYFTFTDSTHTYTAYLSSTTTIGSFDTEQLVFDSETVNASFTESTYSAEVHLIEGESEETLVIKNLAITLKDLVVGSEDSVTYTGDVRFDNVTVEGTLTLKGIGERTTLTVTDKMDIKSGGKVVIEGEVEIFAREFVCAGTMDGEGKAGWAGPSPGGNGTTWKRGGGGGGKGGGGGDGKANAGSGANPDNDDPANPQKTGSKGGDIYGEVGGEGGGYASLTVAGTLTVTGTIDMDGTDGNIAYTSSSGGGSGGGILIRAGKFAGNGSLSADAGNSPTAGVNYPGGGGGGGLVCIYAGKWSFTGSVSVDKGTGYTFTQAQAEDGIYVRFVADDIGRDAGLSGTAVRDECSTVLRLTNFACGEINISNTGGNNIVQGLVGLTQFGPASSVSLYYNNNDMTNGPHPLSPGWTHSLNQYLIKNSGDTQGERLTVSWNRMCGRRDGYWDLELDSTEKYTSMPCYGMANSTIEPTTGGYKLTTRFETYYFKDFTDIGGHQVAQLDRIVDSNGNELTCTYRTEEGKTHLLDYATDAASRQVCFHYDGSDRVDEVWAKYNGSEISDTHRYISYDGNDHLYMAGDGTGSGDWYWEYTYQPNSNNVTKREVFNSTSHGSISYEYSATDSRVVATTTTVAGASSGMTFAYDDDKGKAVVTGRSYNGSDKQTWTHYVDSIVKKFSEDHETYNGDTLTTRRKYDTYGNLVETIDPRGVKTVYTYYAETNDLKSVRATYGTELLSYSEYEYDSCHNMTKSYGPCKGDDKQSAPLANTLVTYYYGTSPELHNLIEVTRKLGATEEFKTRHEYNGDGNLTKTTENYGDTGNERVTEFTYYGSSDPNGPEGFLKETKVDPSGLSIVTTYKVYSNGRLKETTGPMGVVSQHIYDDRWRLKATCSDVGGLQEGYVNTYHEAGMIIKVTRGKFTGTDWSQQNGTCIIDTTAAYSETHYKYESNTGRLIATKDRLSLGTVYEYYENGATKKVMSGEVINWSTTPAIDTGKAYSEASSTYYKNGWLKDTVILLDSSGGGTSSTVTNTYYFDGRIETVTGPKYNSSNNMQVKYYYDYLGRTKEIWRLVEGINTWAITEITYDDYGRTETTTDPELNVTTNTYNNYTGWLATVTAPGNLKTHFDYNDFGQTTTVTQAYDTSDALYSFTEYDAIGRVKKTWMSNVSDCTFANGVNRMQQFYNKNGAAWKTTTYDVAELDGTPFDVDAETTFDKLGRVTAICTDPDALKEGAIYTFDALGRTEYVKQVTFSSFEGDPDQTPGYTINQTLLVAKSKYDNAGRLTHSILNPQTSPGRLESLTTFYKYDELSRQVKVIDPEQWYQNSRSESGAVHTKYVYDNGGRLKEVTVAQDSSPDESSTTKYTYFDNGSREKMQYTQNGSTWIDVTYSYYPSGLLYQKTEPGTGGTDTTTHSYNKNGTLTSKTDGANRTTDFYYDSALRLQYVDEGSDLTYEKEYIYNYRSQIDDIKSLGNLKIDYTYNSCGRLSQVIDYTVFSLSTDTQIDYTYYGGGLRKEMETPDYKLKYEYDKAMRLKKLYRDISGYKLLAAYTYNGLGQRTALTRYHTDGITVKLHTQYDYLADIGWLMKLENRKQVAAGNVISSFKYFDSTAGDGHDCVGNREYMKLDNDDEINYTYDNRYQLLTETRTNGATQLYKYEWSYDDAGNREWQKKWTTVNTWDSYVDYSPTGYEINQANQLLAEYKYDQQGGTLLSKTFYEYADAGNMTDKNIDADADGDIDVYWDYTYSYENRMTRVETGPNGSIAEVGEYMYSVTGTRVQSYIEQTTTLKMFYDGADCVGDYDGSNTRWYVTPGLDENLMMNNGSDYFYTQDGLGSVRELVDTSQTTQSTYDYEAFGSFYGMPTENINNRFTFTGREWDTESETIYHRWRHNFPTLGCFGGRDPVEDTNLYTYVANSPVVHTDPSGRSIATVGDVSWPCLYIVVGDDEWKCGCCVLDVKITPTDKEIADKPWKSKKTVGGKPESGGHGFNVEVSFRLVAKKADKHEFCKLEWWEKASWWPPDFKQKFGEDAPGDDKWFELYGALLKKNLITKEYRGTFKAWDNERKLVESGYYSCGPQVTFKKSIKLPDIPIVMHNSKKRVLQFAPTVRSTPDCGCEIKSWTKFRTQTLDPSLWGTDPKDPNKGFKWEPAGVSKWPPGV